MIAFTGTAVGCQSEDSIPAKLLAYHVPCASARQEADIAPEIPPVPEDTRRRLAEAEQLAIEVDRVVTAAVPDILDIQVAASPDGVVVISGVVFSAEHQRRAEAAARTVKGVQQLIMSLTVT